MTINDTWDAYYAMVAAGDPVWGVIEERELRKLGYHEEADRLARVMAGLDPDGIDDPVPDVCNDRALAPPTWADFVGQTAAINELEVRALSAARRNAPIPPTLLVGPGGTGKTTLAGLIARELDRELVVFSKPPASTDALIDALWAAQDGVVLFDEVHLFTKRQQHDLMDLTEPPHRLQGGSWTIEFPRLSVIAATTEPGALNGPLLTRFECQPAWHDYTEHELVTIVRGMAARAGLTDEQITPELAVTIARASAGIPRTARRLVIAARDIDAARRSVTGAAVLELCQIEPDGLTHEHLRYLNVLATSHRGQAGKEALTTLLQIAPSQVRLTERLLVNRRYVALTGTGRQITPAGRTRLLNGAP